MQSRGEGLCSCCLARASYEYRQISVKSLVNPNQLSEDIVCCMRNIFISLSYSCRLLKEFLHGEPTIYSISQRKLSDFWVVVSIRTSSMWNHQVIGHGWYAICSLPPVNQHSQLIVISLFCSGSASCPSEDEGTWGAEKVMHWGTWALLTFALNCGMHPSPAVSLCWLPSSVTEHLFFNQVVTKMERPSWLFLEQRFYGWPMTDYLCRWRYTQQTMWFH
jgi:hypothetical protein